MSKKFQQLTVKNIRKETDDAFSVSFEVPDSLKKDFQYKAGQYLTLRFNLNGKEIRRSYSMSSSPLDDEITVTIKKVPDGLISNHIAENIIKGNKIEAMPPDGRFFTKPEPDRQKNYYLFGAGSGITPLMSIIRTVLEEEPMSTVFLLYGNRSKNSIIFKDQLEALQHRYAGQLVVVHALSRHKREKTGVLSGFFKKSTGDWEGKLGRINPEMIKEFLADHPPRSKSAEYFICGPGDMIQQTEKTLLKLGVEKTSIRHEYFTTADPSGDQNNTSGSDAPETNLARVLVELDGQKIEIEVPKGKGKTILDTLISKKYDPPYSCTSGSCATCMAKVLKGKVQMDICLALDEEEVAEGYVLTCQSHPVTDEVELTYEV